MLQHMSRTATRAAVAAAVFGTFVIPAGRAAAQAAGADFTWRGAVSPAGWVRVKNLNGAMRVEAASGNEVEVTATKRARRGGDTSYVHITTQRVGPDGQDVLICALWGENARCDERGYHSHSDSDDEDDRRGNVSVDFVVRLPKGTKVAVSTVNGAVRVDGATAEVRASTVNGGIDATSSGGPVTASSVNGDVNVRMGALGTEPLHYATVNGSITVEIPGQLDADVEMTTVNGSLSSDYPMTLDGRINPRHLRATIGKGGRQLRFTTVNGSVRLVKRG